MELDGRLQAAERRIAELTEDLHRANIQLGLVTAWCGALTALVIGAVLWR
ncbi:hypothetical protein ACLBX9_09785 [Methylobacterium sp. A49B]